MWPIFLPPWTCFTPLEVEPSQGRASEDPSGGDRVGLGSYGHRPMGGGPPGWLVACRPGTLRRFLGFRRCRDSGAGLELRWSPGFVTCCVTLGTGPGVRWNLAPLGTARPWHVVTRVKCRLWGCWGGLLRPAPRPRAWRGHQGVGSAPPGTREPVYTRRARAQPPESCSPLSGASPFRWGKLRPKGARVSQAEVAERHRAWGHPPHVPRHCPPQALPGCASPTVWLIGQVLLSLGPQFLHLSQMHPLTGPAGVAAGQTHLVLCIASPAHRAHGPLSCPRGHEEARSGQSALRRLRPQLCRPRTVWPRAGGPRVGAPAAPSAAWTQAPRTAAAIIADCAAG